MSHSKFTEFKKLVSDRRAVTMLEYGIIAALVTATTA